MSHERGTIEFFTLYFKKRRFLYQYPKKIDLDACFDDIYFNSYIKVAHFYEKIIPIRVAAPCVRIYIYTGLKSVI